MLCFVCYITLTMPGQPHSRRSRKLQLGLAVSTHDPQNVFERLVDYFFMVIQS